VFSLEGLFYDTVTNKANIKREVVDYPKTILDELNK
jgi:hypothetical protein